MFLVGGLGARQNSLVEESSMTVPRNVLRLPSGTLVSLVSHFESFQPVFCLISILEGLVLGHSRFHYSPLKKADQLKQISCRHENINTYAIAVKLMQPLGALGG